eukprot:TRINITY_DN10530_c0_g1_i1.p1 TRINITY_DN10530_c0_g1~~TRINITY_DN10530_c0_g1_i1.p1  ORF type:complete len:587 (+),score=103.98 TRINITY_DN10530_c0_g1_i1:58-1818(+)
MAISQPRRVTVQMGHVPMMSNQSPVQPLSLSPQTGLGGGPRMFAGGGRASVQCGAQSFPIAGGLSPQSHPASPHSFANQASLQLPASPCNGAHVQQQQSNSPLGRFSLQQVGPHMNPLNLQPSPQIHQLGLQHPSPQPQVMEQRRHSVQPVLAQNLHQTQMQGGCLGADGKFVDREFPPHNDSIFRTATPQQDHIHDVLAQTHGGKVTWRRVSEFCTRLFNNIHPNDIAQGILGDCWLLAGIAGLAEFKNRVQELFRENDLSHDGKYNIKIYDMNTRQWNWVVIDDYIPFQLNGKPCFSKPHEEEAWVLLLEKAVAKWMGSYIKLQGAFAMTPFMLLTDLGRVRCFSQTQVNGVWSTHVLEVKEAALQDAHDRNSVAFHVLGKISADDAFLELKKADDAESLMSAWTTKDPPRQVGVGKSGEALASDGIAKAHAYSLVCADFFKADNGETWRIVQLRNPWGNNKHSEWNGELSDDWPGWVNFPRLKAELKIDDAGCDGLFFMRYETFLERFSDFGLMPGCWQHGKHASVETGLKYRPGNQAAMSVFSSIGAEKKFRKPARAAVPLGVAMSSNMVVHSSLGSGSIVY